MRIALPDDCGHAPRVMIVSEFVASWAAGNSDALAVWLAEDVRWEVMGKDAFHGLLAAAQVRPPVVAQYLEIRSAITHGRFAACDGYTTTGTARMDFCHMFRFTGAGKTAKIAEIRTYLTWPNGQYPAPS